MTPSDFAFATYFLSSIGSLIASIFVFKFDVGMFSWTIWIYGFIGSLCNVLGSLFATSAFCTGAAVGPIVAMLNV